MAKKFKLKGSYNTGFINNKEIDETRFSIDYRRELNSSQFEAVSVLSGAYLVIAGAGTGKTRTLVYRVARLVEIGYDPEPYVVADALMYADGQQIVSFEEPYTVIPSVRLCGGEDGVIRRPTRLKTLGTRRSFGIIARY